MLGARCACNDDEVVWLGNWTTWIVVVMLEMDEARWLSSILLIEMALARGLVEFGHS